MGTTTTRRWWLLVLLLWLPELLPWSAEAHYLSVSSRWLVKESDGTTRVKLACVNWAAHLDTMLPEGLNRQPLYRAAMSVKTLGFNCVRVTFPTHLFTSSANQTVDERLTQLSLDATRRGVAIHNPDIIGLSLLDAFKYVVGKLTRAGLLVILDNHASKPGWSNPINKDGFWGDSWFRVDEWTAAISAASAAFADNNQVVGVSLRTGLRGPRQNVADWLAFMTRGAKAAYSANPHLVVILSGLHSDTDLRFLGGSAAAKLASTLPSALVRSKLVFQLHWYDVSYGVNFASGNLNRACAIATSAIMASARNFLSTSNVTAPLMISEFGVDQRGDNRAQSRYVTCLFAFMAGLDLDWSYWALQGSYYTRNGIEGDEEFSGVLNWKWSAPRNISFLARLQGIQQSWKSTAVSKAFDNGARVDSYPYLISTTDYQVLYHPATGLCLEKGYGSRLLLGPCSPERSAKWRRTSDGRLQLMGSNLCIAAEGDGESAKLENAGSEKNGPWNLVSVAQLQLATKIVRQGGCCDNDDSEEVDGLDIIDGSVDAGVSNTLLCLDGSDPPSVTTEQCMCVDKDDVDCGPADDPSHQWFVFISVDTNSSGISVPF